MEESSIDVSETTDACDSRSSKNENYSLSEPSGDCSTHSLGLLFRADTPPVATPRAGSLVRNGSHEQGIEDLMYLYVNMHCKNVCAMKDLSIDDFLWWSGVGTYVVNNRLCSLSFHWPILDVIKFIGRNASKHLKYQRKFTDYVDDFQRAQADLQAKEADIQQHLKDEHRFGKMPRQEAMKEVCTEGHFSGGLVVNDPSIIAVKLPASEVVGSTSVREEIYQYLMGDDVGMIGVCGMGGIGKTTIMKDVHNRLLKESKFRKLIWVTVSQEFDIRRLQTNIECQLGGNLSDDEDTIVRDVGILETTSNDGCKIVLTTRAERVAQSMGFKKVRVPCLSMEEAIDLFLSKVGQDVLLNPTSESFMNLVMKVILRKDGCLAAISERPVDFTYDNKWLEIDENVMANFHLALADEVLSSIEEKNTSKEIWDDLTKLCTIGEQEHSELLLQSLPDSYDQLIINLTNSNVTSLVFDNVTAAVLQEENQRKNKEDKQVNLQQVEVLTTMRGRSTERGQSRSHKYDDGDALCCEALTTVEDRKKFADIWLIDSGATYYMTSRREWFHHYESVSGGSVYSCNDHALDIVGVGTIKLKMYDEIIKVVRDKLGHMSEQGIKVLVEQKLLPGLATVSLTLCEHCITITSLGGAKYFVSFIDYYSRRCWVYPIKKKSDVSSTFKKFKEIMHQKTVYSGEHSLIKWSDRADEHNLVRKNKSNIEGCRPRKIILGRSNQYRLLFGESSSINCNRAKDTMKMWTGKPVDYSNLHVFGSIVYVIYNSQEILKLDPKSRKYKLLGYDDGVKGYRLWNPTARKVIISRDVIFVEDKLQRKEDDDKKSETTQIYMEKEVEQGDSFEAEPTHDEQEPESFEAPTTRQSDRPEGFEEDEKKNLVCRLNKSLYGLKQALRCWYKIFDSFIAFLGYNRLNADPCAYLKSEQERIEMSRVSYALAVGSLMFAMICTKPYIAQAVGVSVVATSTTEAEYVPATQASKETIWLKMLLEEIGHNQKYVSLFYNSQSTLHLARNPTFHSRTKHIRVQYNFIREKVEEETVDMHKIYTKDNIADFITKAINADKFTWCRYSCLYSATSLAIVTLAGCTRGISDPRVWENTVDELRDCEIGKEEIIKYWIEVVLIDEMGSRKAMEHCGHSILQKLEENCLLERVQEIGKGTRLSWFSFSPYIGKDTHIKVHDLVRDMALHITRKRFMVKVGKQLKELPHEEE
ncbi:Nbs-lrr resistance protein [Hibiscus syriacus]|uniref:Nbs-lrr resistance protein n=1 Tax=Hibiscus syriacus TaxID=106335 RepID=A0A6A2XR99_HIBSY|nr:Nbs-lrr resistance protein [Hibiscus syriacus]